MGSRTSKIKSPYELLEVTPYNSLKEIKLSYIRLCKINMSSELNNAYSLIKDSPPPLSLYTKEDPDMIIEKINLYAKTNIPPLSSENYKKTYRQLSRLRNYEMSYHIDRLVRYWKENDARLKIDEIKVVQTEETKIVQKVKDKNNGPFLKCLKCDKTFKSINTLNDHYKSRKHINNNKGNIEEGIKEKNNNKEEIREKNNNKEEIREKNNNKEKIGEKNNNEGLKGKNNNGNINTDIPYKLDHLIFRTCSHCKKVFDSRVFLLYHLRDEHAK